MIEHLFALKTLIAMFVLLFFSILLCTFSILVETESFEAMICALERTPLQACRSDFIKKVEALPGLKVKELSLNNYQDKSYLEARIEVASKFQISFLRNETLEIK